MFCENCGHNIGEGKSYCRNCGARVEQQEEEITTFTHSSPKDDRQQFIMAGEIELKNNKAQALFGMLGALLVLSVMLGTSFMLINAVRASDTRRDARGRNSIFRDEDLVREAERFKKVIDLEVDSNGKCMEVER